MHLSPQRSRPITSLPVSLIYEGDAEPGHSRSISASPAPDEVKRTAGPIPKSWVKSSSQVGDSRYTPEWRSKALSLAFSHLPLAETALSCLVRHQAYITNGPPRLPRVPSLTLQCLRLFMGEYSDSPEFADDLLPWISPHMRRDLIRYASIHSPLGSSKLYQLWAAEGHAAGEMIVVGPQASVRLGAFRREPTSGADPDEEEEDWDAPVGDSETPLQSLLILSAALPVSLVSALPPTLVHLVLIELPPSIQPHIHRLPGICPLLELFDLSYNSWLSAGGGEKLLERVEWGRWTRLRTLGMRGCEADAQFAARVNKGRWQDVDIILR
jgi:hypothetical protein